MALGDENAEDEKEEKPKVYKSAIDSEDVASTSRNSHRPTAAGVGEQDDVKQEKNDVCLEANVQPCPSTSGSASGSSSSDGIAKHPSKDASAASGVGGPATVAVNGASPKAGNGKPANATASTVPTTCPEAGRSTAFTRTHSNRLNGLDAFMNGLSNPNYYVGMPPGLAYLAAGPSSGGSSTTAHGVIHPMASYPHNLPVLYQAAAATAHLMGNRFPGSPNPASSPFSFQQGAAPFAGFSPCYPTAPDGGQSAPSQAAAGPAAFPFALCGDPKTVGIRSPFGFFAAGQCSPSFGPPMLMQPTVLEQWYAAARYSSPMFPLMMTAAGSASAPVPCSPNATLSPIVNSSPIAGGAPSLTPAALAPPALIPAYPATYGANSLRFPSAASATATNALAAMSQIPVPVVTTSVKSIASNLVANTGQSSSASRNPLTQNGSSSTNSNPVSAARNRTSISEQRHDENGMGSNSAGGHSRSSHEKALKKLTHIKKPLNAFMLYMKEMRPIVMQEVGLKERQSAEINRILGRRWHSLTRDEQQKYYDLARQERTLHMQRYPNWSARDNYALHKKKKRKRDKAQENLEMKKCRARFGLDQQSKWCKHCRRKKKCLWFREGAGTNVSTASSSGIQENGADSAEQSPPCAQVTSTTNGPDALASSSTVLAAETDVNSPQSLVTSTITIAVGGRLAPLSANGGGSNKKKVSVSTAAAAAVPKNGAGRSTLSPARKKRRRTESTGGELSDDDDGAASSSGSDDDDASSDGDEFEEDEEIDEEAEAAAAARAAVEGADFDEEMSALISPPSSDQNNGLAEEGQSSTVTQV